MQKKVIIVAPATESGLIRGALPPHDFVVIQEVPTLTQDKAEAIAAADTQLVIVSSNVPGFAIQHVQRMIKGENPRVVVAFAQPFGDQFDLLSQVGAVPYKIPVRPEAVQEVAQNFDALLAQATQHFVQGGKTLDEMPMPALREDVALGVGALMRTTPFVYWGLSGGVGKTTLTRDASMLLAAVLGRRVLMVDADMSRGILSTLFTSEVYRQSQTKHIAAAANLRRATGKMPPLNEFVLSLAVPDEALASPQEGVLDLLAGLPSPDMATMEGFTGDNGEAGRRFVQDLLKAAAAYEYVNFDIGPIVPVPLHLGALGIANIVFVIARPVRGDIVQLKRALGDLEQTAGVSPERMRLIINMQTPHNSLKIEEIAATLGIPLITQIPALPATTMQELANNGKTALEAWLDDRKNADLTAYLRSLIPILEIMLPGASAMIKGRFPDLVVSKGRSKAKDGKKKRRGLFRR